MPKKRLTDSNVASLKPMKGEAQTDYWDWTVPRFGVRAGARPDRICYVVRYTFGVNEKGQPKKHRKWIGYVKRIGLADARKKADAILAKVDDGLDPDASEPRSLKRLTVAQLWEEYRTRHRKKDGTEKRSWKSEEIRFNRDLAPTLGGKLAETVTDADIEAIIDAMRERGVKTGATRTFETARALFRWAMKKKLLANSPMDRMEAPFETGKRRRYLDDGLKDKEQPRRNDSELARYWRAIVAVEDDGKTRRHNHARLLALMLLLGARGGALRQAKWSDLNLESGTWTIPTEGNKAERDFDLPLPARAIALFEAQRGLSDTWVFPRLDGEPEPHGTEAAEVNRKVCADAGIVNYLPHDHRHTAATFLEAMGFDELTVAAIVGHTRRSMTGRYSHYRRENEMRDALNAWERRLLTIAGEIAPETNVTEFGSRRSAAGGTG